MPVMPIVTLSITGIFSDKTLNVSIISPGILIEIRRHIVEYRFVFVIAEIIFMGLMFQFTDKGIEFQDRHDRNSLKNLDLLFY